MAVSTNCDRCGEAAAVFSLSNLTNGDTVWLCLTCTLASAADAYEAAYGPVIEQLPDSAQLSITDVDAAPSGPTGDGGALSPATGPDASGSPGDSAGGGDGSDGPPYLADATPSPAPKPKTSRSHGATRKPDSTAD